VGFEAQSKNRGRAEKSRLKKEVQIKELVPPMSVTNPAAYKAMLDRQIAKNVKVKTALGNKKHKDHNKAKSLVKRFIDKFRKKESVNEIRKFHPKKLGDYYLGGFNSSKGDTEMFADKKGQYYIWVKPKGKKERYIDLPKNIKDRSKADVFHDKIKKTMGESVEEGFGGELKGAEKKKFEKARKENAEVLGYKVTGKSDIKESINEASNIDKIKDIVKKKSYKRIGGVIVDMQTANAILQVYKALNTANRKKYEKLSISKMADVAWKLMK
jgi:hypothetical protein